MTTDETWLDEFADRRAALLAQPYSTVVSREVERIDATIDFFWGEIEARIHDAD